jgi:hypothetical protein
VAGGGRRMGAAKLQTAAGWVGQAGPEQLTVRERGWTEIVLSGNRFFLSHYYSNSNIRKKTPSVPV